MEIKEFDRIVIDYNKDADRIEKKFLEVFKGNWLTDTPKP